MPLSQMNQMPNDESIISTIFIERNPEFDARLQEIKQDLSNNYDINAAKSMRRFMRYEIQGLSYEEIWKVNYQVFSTLELDRVVEPTELFDQEYILPLTPVNEKYDHQSISAMSLLDYYFPYREIYLRSTEILIFTEKISDLQKDVVQSIFFENTHSVVSQLKPVLNLGASYSQPGLVSEIVDFRKATQKTLEDLLSHYNLNMQLADLKQVQSYFKKIKREPTETELLLIDQIKSENLNFKNTFPLVKKAVISKDVAQEIKASHDLFINSTQKTGAKSTLDFAINNPHNDLPKQIKFEINAKQFSIEDVNEQENTLSNLIVSSEIDGNKPVQGMRISMASCESESLKTKSTEKFTYNQEIANRSKILQNQARQTSFYAKKTNVPISYVREYYRPEFKDRHYEISALLSEKIEINPTTPAVVENDLIVILGAKTKPLKDNMSSMPELNNILSRFILNPEIRTMLKIACSPCRTGIASTIARLNRGAILNFDVLPVVAGEISGTDIALSKTPDRMLAVISVKDRHRFVGAAQTNNLEATVIGKIVNNEILEINLRGQKIVELNKEIFDNKEISLKISPEIKSGKISEVKVNSSAFSKNFLEKISKSDNSPQFGLNKYFANHLNDKNVLAALGGSNQSSPEQGMISEIVKDELFTIVTASSFPGLMKQSPYYAAYYSIFCSYLKNISLGGNPEKVKIALYNSSYNIATPEDWGDLYSMQLGAFQAEQDLGIDEIVFENEISKQKDDTAKLPVTISFALSSKSKKIFSSASLEKPGLYGYLVNFEKTENGLLNKNAVNQVLTCVYQMIDSGIIKHSVVCESDLATSIYNSCLGENLGFEFDNKLLNQALFADNTGSLVIFTEEKITKLSNSKISPIYIGKSIADQKIVRRKTELNLVEAAELTEHHDRLYNFGKTKRMPLVRQDTRTKAQDKAQTVKINKPKAKPKNLDLNIRLEKPKILLPIFKHTIGEERLVEELVAAGAEVEQFIFYSTLGEWTQRSIRSFSEKINDADALILPGGYDLNDQPEGVAKLICLILENNSVKNAINNLLDRKGKILGIGNGFQALIACGLLPYGRYREWGDKQGFFANSHELSGYNGIIDLEVVSTKGNWYESTDEIFQACLIADYWNLNLPPALWDFCLENNLIISKFKSDDNEYIESITSPEGNILGRITHSEFSAAEILNLPQKQDLDFFKRFVSEMLDIQFNKKLEKILAEQELIEQEKLKILEEKRIQQALETLKKSALEETQEA